MNNKLYQTIEEYVSNLFEQIPAPALKFHNVLHTQNVVKNAMSIAQSFTISESEKFMLFAAAWFHDVGYLFVDPKFHEEKGCNIMRNFLSGRVENKMVIGNIEQCIMATKAPVDPQNLLQTIICDADVYHFGTKEFEVYNKLVFEEYKLKNHSRDFIKFSEDTIKMFRKHRFFTDYCKDLLSEQKLRNLEALQKSIVKCEGN